MENFNQKIELDIVLLPEGEGESRVYSISCIHIPNVVTQGNTIEQAKNRLKEVLGLYFEEMPEEKNKIIRIVKEENNAPMISRIFL